MYKYANVPTPATIGRADTLNNVAAEVLINPNSPIFQRPTFKPIFIPAAIPYPAAPIPEGVIESRIG